MWTQGLLLVLGAIALGASAQDLPTLYEYYTEGGISSGLEAPNTGFTLNQRDITLYSGSIHYFRVHPDLWRDRLRKARAAGLNTIDTYVPWNLHEPRMGVFDFGTGNDDFSSFLDVRRFVQMAQEEDLFVIFRPGPYICAEWEFGGLPSWLLRYEGIKVRTSDPIYTAHMKQFFDQLLQQVVDLTFKRGGSIIAVQIENEYGNFGINSTRDTEHLEYIRQLYIDNGIDELYFTSDSQTISGDIGAVPGELQMANFDDNPAANFDILLQLQPTKALMAMEYWTGWFDHWLALGHNSGNTPQEFADYLSIIFSYNASVNMYMFHGGSSFGFMNGANSLPVFPRYVPDISSYDYSAPLSEAGDYTEKYRLAKELIIANNKVETIIPEQPAESIKTIYPTISTFEYLSIAQILSQVPAEDRTNVLEINTQSSMENLPFNEGNGQSYGLIAYRTQIMANSPTATLKVTGHVRDVAMVLVDGDQQTQMPNSGLDIFDFGMWYATDSELNLTVVPEQTHDLDIIVENFGRNNFGGPGDFDQKKGLWEGPVLLDEVPLLGWEVTALQLKGSWIRGLTGWQALAGETVKGPVMLRATFTLDSAPTDTFLDMRTWGKGYIFVNGFPLGRYFHVGPQLTSYIPAPLLKQGVNEIVIFEHYEPASELVFTVTPDLG